MPVRSVERRVRRLPCPRRARRWPMIALACLAAGPGAAAVADAAPADPDRAASTRAESGRTLDLGELLGAADNDGFARVLGPRAFEFPADHGAHPDFRTEWWYLTAHLEDEAGNTFGVQFTLFRQALAPPGKRALAPPGQKALATPEERALAPDSEAPSDSDGNGSAWRTATVWMAHVGLLAPTVGHQSAERFARGALGLAGVRAAPFEAWLDDWTLTGPAAGGAASAGLLPLELELRVPEVEVPFEVRLTLDGERPSVLQGDAGFSPKSGREGNASHYYSYTRLQASGEVRIDGRSHTVRGLGWLDREWSTSVLDDGLLGWDWFALHLDDGRDLMVYHLRRADGAADPFSAGVLVAADGSRQRLGPADWTLEPLDFWTDERGVDWPVAWRLVVPAAGVDGVVRAQRPDQLNRLAVRYWEGVVCLDGALPGCGYLELTGYR